MTNPCNPPAAPLAVLTPCAMLPLLRGALLELLSGKGRAEVRMQDQTLRFQNANLSELRKEIMRLENMCDDFGQPNNRGRAMGTLHRPAGSLGFPNGRYR